MTRATPEIEHPEAWTAKDGLAVVIRPIRPADEPLMARFHESLSAASVYTRLLQRLEAEQQNRPRAAPPDLRSEPGGGSRARRRNRRPG